MNINCINNKIANANSVLKPIILQAIREIYLNGNHQMTARMVKNQCIILDANILWDKKNPTVCNSMRNSIECGGRIIGEDRDFNDFTISFDVNNRNPKKSKVDATSKVKKVDTDAKNKKSNMSKDCLVADKKIDELINSLDWKKLKDKKTPKLLIIGCSDSKSHQPINLVNGEFVNYNFGANIINQRLARINFYQGLPEGYFINIKRNGGLVNMNYFMASLNNNNRREALDVYGSNKSPFYNPAMKCLYRIKIAESELHLLIVSGLYGIIKHNDYINDYHLKINKGSNVWGNFISLAVSQYIQAKFIDNDAVFYSLSGNYLPLLQPNPLWKNLWLNHDGYGYNQANDLRDFLNQL